MSNTDKCFCHLNGYAVKDATARQQIAALTEQIAALTQLVTALAEKYEVVENSAVLVSEVEIQTTV